MANEFIEIVGDKLRLNLHQGQTKAWDSDRRFVFAIAGTQGGKTTFGPWWLNREIERTTGGKGLPRLSHLRESGAIEQDADVVAFLHRPRDETQDISGEALREGIESMLIVEKNRNGQTGTIYLTFHPRTMEFKSRSRYTDIDRPEAIEETQ